MRYTCQINELDWKRTIYISPGEVNTLDFNLTPEQQVFVKEIQEKIDTPYYYKKNSKYEYRSTKQIQNSDTK